MVSLTQWLKGYSWNTLYTESAGKELIEGRIFGPSFLNQGMYANMRQAPGVK